MAHGRQFIWSIRLRKWGREATSVKLPIPFSLYMTTQIHVILLKEMLQICHVS